MPANEVILKQNGIIESGNEGLESFGAVQLGFVNQGTVKPFYEPITIVHDISLPPVLGISLEGPPPPPWCVDLKIIPEAPLVPPAEFGPMPPLSPLLVLPLKPGIPPVFPSVIPTSPSPPLSEILPFPAPPPLLVTAAGTASPPGAICHYSRAGARFRISVSGTLNATTLPEGVYSYIFYIHKGPMFAGPLTPPTPYGISPLSRIARVGIGFCVAAAT